MSLQESDHRFRTRWQILHGGLKVATAVWKGRLRFGLLTLLVKLYRAAQAEKISFRQLQKTTGARVRHTLSAEVVHVDAGLASNDAPAEKSVDNTRPTAPSTRPAVIAHAGMQRAALKREDVVKAYEYAKGMYISLSPQELSAHVPATAREIE